MILPVSLWEPPKTSALNKAGSIPPALEEVQTIDSRPKIQHWTPEILQSSSLHENICGILTHGVDPLRRSRDQNHPDIQESEN